MTDEQITAAAVQLAGESTGDFIAGAHWAIGGQDITRDALWSAVYLESFRQRRPEYECALTANDAVKYYDKRVKS